VTIGSASIALQDDDSPSSAHLLQPITFAGQANITIPRGAVVFSDPLSMNIPSDDNLAVSLYIEGDSGFVTAHELSNQISYISSTGDYSDDAALPVASETESWPFLTAIDVIPSQPTSAIVTLGDSITDGWGSTMSANHRWPNFLARRLYQDDRSKDYAVVNAGISGNRVTTEQNPTFGQNLQARFERDVLALSNISHIILLEGVNDIGMSFRSDHPVSASDIIAGYHQIIARAHARGIKVIGATLLPYEDAGYYSEAGNTVRQEVNTFIRSSGAFDGVIEFSRAVADPTNANRIRAEFTADNLHPNDDGYAAMAEIIDLRLFQ